MYVKSVHTNVVELVRMNVKLVRTNANITTDITHTM